MVSRSWTCAVDRNLQSWKIAIPVHQLKPAIKDAMMTALRLGFSYIWVDSLCIVQNDEADLGREIMDMGRLYKASSCTIAADAADQPAAGCFIDERDVRPITTYDVELELGQITRHSISLSWYTGTDAVRGSVLHKRGWVFQERFASPRILHFGKQQLHWECLETEASEVFPNGRPVTSEEGRTPHQAMELSELRPREALLPSTRESYETVRRMLCHTFDSSALAPEELAIFSVHKQWSTVVEEYTECNMSFDMDRLRGLLGIATMSGLSLDLRTWYGLWHSTLPLSLLWAPGESSIEEDATPSSRRRINDVAPSWSWASISGPIIFLETADVVGHANFLGYEFLDKTASDHAVPAPPHGQFPSIVMSAMAWSGTLTGETGENPETLDQDRSDGSILSHENGDSIYMELDCAEELPLEVIGIGVTSHPIHTAGLLLASVGIADTYRRVGHYTMPGPGNSLRYTGDVYKLRIC